MGGVAGEALRAFRLSRSWDTREMARRIGMAATATLQKVPSPGTLAGYIRRWEAGTNDPSERYRLLYRRVFPGLITADGDLTGEGAALMARYRGLPAPAVNGTAPHAPAPEDPAAVLDRAQHLPGDGSTLTAAAARSGKPELIAMASAVSGLEQQVAVLRERLEYLLGEERRRR